MATKLTLEEQETHINLVAADRSVWEVQSDDPVMIARLDKIATAYRTTDIGKWYRLETNQIRFFKTVTPEQKEQAAVNARRNFAPVASVSAE